MRYLILGSSGLIGQNLNKHLIDKGHLVEQFDIEIRPTHDLRCLGNPLLKQAIDKSDFVYFLAFDTGGSKYLSSREADFSFISNNVKIMLNVFEELASKNRSFVFASSQMSQMHHSSYGTLKSVGEFYTRSLNGLIVKFWNVYGHETVGKKSHVVSDFIHQATTTDRIQMLTDGNESRQFLYVDDCVEALYSLSQLYNSLPKDQSLDITSFEWTKIKDLAKIVSTFFGNCEVIPGDAIDGVQLNVTVEPHRAILKHWRPEIDLPAGIEKTIRIYRGQWNT